MRPLAKKVWQYLHTNVCVPKRLRNGPVAKEPRSGYIVQLESDLEPPPTTIKKRANKKRGEWSKEDIQLVLEAIASKKMSMRKAGEYTEYHHQAFKSGRKEKKSPKW